MRILMVTRETGPDRRYGLGRSLMPVIDAMQAQGHAVRYFTQDDLSETQVAQRKHWWDRIKTAPWLRRQADLLVLAWAWLHRLQVGFVAARLARKDGYTHVHAHDPWIAAGVALGLAGAGRRIAWGITQHGFGSYAMATLADGLAQAPSTQRWLLRIERFVLARAGWAIAPTRMALDALAAELQIGHQPRHWHVVPHARPAVTAATVESRAQARAQLGWGDDFVVIAVGRLAPLKCFDRVIDACASLQPPVRLVILGDGDAAPLRDRAAERGFADRLHIEAVQDVQPWLHAADAYVSASSTESFGLANLEALCAGLPAVCSEAGAVPEVMGEGAWLVPNDTSTLAGCIAALRDDPALRASWSARALARTAAWPLPQEIARRYVDIYQSALAR